MEKFLKVGVITSAHGVRGEVKVYPTTDDPERFLDLDAVILEKGGKREEHAIRGVKFFKNMVILKLEGIDSMNDAERFRQWDLMIPRGKGRAACGGGGILSGGSDRYGSPSGGWFPFRHPAGYH